MTPYDALEKILADAESQTRFMRTQLQNTKGKKYRDALSRLICERQERELVAREWLDEVGEELETANG